MYKIDRVSIKAEEDFLLLYFLLPAEPPGRVTPHSYQLSLSILSLTGTVIKYTDYKITTFSVRLTIRRRRRNKQTTNRINTKETNKKVLNM